MKTNNITKIASLVGAICLVAAGCGSSGNDESEMEDAKAAIPSVESLKKPEETELIVQGASPAPNIGYLPMYVAQKKEYFDEEGVSVKINYSHGDSAPLQAISTGKAEIMSGTPEELILGYEKGLRGVLFHQTYKHLIFRVAAPKDSSKVREPADLEDKTVGVSSMASTGVLITKVLLKEAGGDPESVEFLPVGTGQQALSAVKSGKVDALALWDSPYSVLETSGADFNYWQPDTLDEVGDGGYFSTWETIKDRPNALAHFSRAIAKAMKFIKEEPEKSLEIYWSVNPDAKPSGPDAEALKTGLKQLKIVGKSLDMSGEPKEVDKDSLKTYVDTFKDQGLIKEEPPTDSIVTNKFVPLAKDAVE